MAQELGGGLSGARVETEGPTKETCQFKGKLSGQNVAHEGLEFAGFVGTGGLSM